MRPGRRSAAPSTRAAPPPSRSAAGRRATWETCSRRAGRLQPEVQYEAERAHRRRSVGARSGGDERATAVEREKASGPALARFLETVRADDPDNPFWKGVRQIVVAENHVDLEMFEPLAPRQLGVGPTRVECHLFDDAALEEAGRRELERERSGG